MLRRGAAFYFHGGFAGEADVPDEAAFFQGTDCEPGEVELPPFEAVAGGGGEGVVVVVPAFAEGEDAEDRVVAAFIGGSVGAGSPDVADGVDAPGDVVEQGGADEAAPEDAGEEAGPRVAECGGDQAGDNPAEQEPEPEKSVNECEHGVADQIG